MRRGRPVAVEIVAGDFSVPESLDTALQGVRSVFLLWTAPPVAVQAVIPRFAAHGPRVVFLSHRTRRRIRSSSSPTRWRTCTHIERLIANAGIASTIIRPGMLASNARFWWADAIRRGDVVRWPYGAAETAPIDERDVAAVAARALTEVRHAGKDYVLTGPESLSQAEQVRIIGEAIGRPARFQQLSPDEFRSETAGTWPRPIVDMLLDAWGVTIGTGRSSPPPSPRSLVCGTHVSAVGRRSRRRVSVGTGMRLLDAIAILVLSLLGTGTAFADHGGADRIGPVRFDGDDETRQDRPERTRSATDRPLPRPWAPRLWGGDCR